MRVLHVIPSVATRTGGTATGVIALSRALQDAGIDVEIFATSAPGPAQARDRRHIKPADLPLSADELTVRAFPTAPPRRLAYSPALGRALKNGARDFDLIHLHSLWLYPQFAGARAARQAEVPYIVSLHGALDPFLRSRGRLRKQVTSWSWQDQALRRAAALHITTEEEGRLLPRLAPDVPRCVVPYGVNWREFQTAPSRPPTSFAAVGASEEERIILDVGRISFKKRLDVLIEALPRVRETVPARLLIAGPDDEALREQLETLASELGVRDEVRFLGPIYGAEMHRLLAVADVWALPSHTENFGIAVVEAMAAGIPTIVSPQVNLAADISSCGAGIVAERTPASFAEAIIAVLTDAGLAAGLASRGRDFAMGYSWGRVADRMIEVYRAVTGAPPPPASGRREGPPASIDRPHSVPRDTPR